MALKIKPPEADHLACEEGSAPTLADEILAIGRRCAALPELDSRSPDDIIGSDAHGLPP
jgi:antitoxin VapB